MFTTALFFFSRQTQAGLKLWGSRDPPTSAGWIVRTTGMHHHTWKQHLSFSFPFFLQYLGLNSGFSLARQVLYSSSHAFSPFCCGYFRDRVSLFVQASLDHNPPILSTLFIGMMQVHTTTPNFFFSWDGVLQTFLPRLA
jgi:hypothetical protein